MMRTFQEQREREAAMIRKDRAEWLSEIAKHFDSTSGMAAAIGVDNAYLAKVADDAGVRLPKSNRTASRRKAYEALAAEGLTAPQVADRMGVKLATVHCAANKYGLCFADGRAKHDIAPKGPRAPAPDVADPLAAMRQLAAKENAAMRRRDRA
ncbi:hypothetical protein [Roseovarius sp.]